MVLKKYALLVLLFTVTFSACGQQKGENEKTDAKNSSTKIFREPLTTTIYRLQEKVELQALELNVYKNLHKIDTVRYRNDSVIIFFKGQDDTILKKIKEFVWEISGDEDSSIYYFNKNGLIVYEEFWGDDYTKIDSIINDTIRVKSKVAFARNEYDSDGKLIRRVKLMPDEFLFDTKITYDSNGNPIRDTKRKTAGRYLFWGSVKETLEK